MEIKKKSKQEKKPKKTPMAKAMAKKRHVNDTEFLGLDEILLSVIRFTQPSYAGKKDEAQRLKQIKGSLFGQKESIRPAHRPEEQLTEDIHKQRLYIPVARDILKAVEQRQAEIIKSTDKRPIEETIKLLRNVRVQIEVTPFVRKHIRLLLNEQFAGEEFFVKNWAKKYRNEGIIYEDAQFLEKYEDSREIADQLAAAMILNSQKERHDALEEIFNCLRKHKWPI